MTTSSTSPGRRTAGETRDRIVVAAGEVLAELGLAHATTKEIARASGCSEALLYKHFPDKGALFVAVLRERFPPFVADLARLPESAGTGEVHGALVEVVVRAIPFYRHGVPVLGSLFADPALLRRHRDEFGGAGPRAVNRSVAEYLRRERALGRVPSNLDPVSVADLLVGACFQRGFLEAFGEVDLPPAADFAEGIVRSLLPPA